jgi:glycosyltransferase involved in cell wall biosynthesis
MYEFRIIALLAVYNEERFIAASLDHLINQGLQVYLIDNSSTDQTVAIAERYLGKGLIGIDEFPRAGVYSWKPILQHKEYLASTLDADWFMHVDADEIRLSPYSNTTLAQAISKVDAQGFNAVNFMEFTFIPTKESPDHDHSNFQETMRWYYPFLPSFPHRLNAWKRQSNPVDLARSGGHRVQFPGLNMYLESFRMRHYLFLSIPHAIQKYVNRVYDPLEVERGWHNWRSKIESWMMDLPSQNEMRTYQSDVQLDASNPRVKHFFDELMDGKKRSGNG